MKHKRQPKILRDTPVELESITKTPITISPNTSILDAKDILLRYRIGRLVVKLGKKAIGIITEKDIAKSVSIFSGKPIEKILVKDAMSKDLVTVPSTSSIYDCAKQMITHNISSIIINDKRENLVGIITKTDLVSTFLAQSTASLSISKIMTKKVITVSPEDSVFEVQSVLFNNKISRVVVTKNKRPIGIITYRDFIPAKTFDLQKEFTDPAERDEISSNQQLNEFNVNQMSYLLTFSAKDIMTKELVITYPDNDVYTAAILMIRHGISGIPVILNQRLVGIITKSDIVNVLALKGKLN
ncbi:Inosine-5-monophosphate dehydrogenase, cystathionine beta-synthase [Candidatus Nitrosarchaeum limnium SFB1]|jgi:CBS domain-containing protein|uniref:Inosine-5-monophosphate dehydrogenase, cystathionine beta-synthase n=1 Tax=Candidatus Nitrosarchaeum limnium SFB1 TaxID=886738 RepID=F3KK05_9ARCH|nr:Inosine-5-monophosphate dehydrogenase, cystathionine beta-synthase [Candidatus Nitrosarchaeum limnium SFB1]